MVAERLNYASEKTLRKNFIDFSQGLLERLSRVNLNIDGIYEVESDSSRILGLITTSTSLRLITTERGK
jgi:hypothetical protein